MLKMMFVRCNVECGVSVINVFIKTMAEMIMCTGRRVAHSDEPTELKTNCSSQHCSKKLFIKLYT